MKCANCPYLKILYMPLRDDNAIWDFGKAKCTKYDLYTDFGYKGKFNKMDCVEENGTLEQLKEQKNVELINNRIIDIMWFLDSILFYIFV